MCSVYQLKGKKLLLPVPLLDNLIFICIQYASSKHISLQIQMQCWGKLHILCGLC
jgi:hypothetical protein